MKRNGRRTCPSLSLSPGKRKKKKQNNNNKKPPLENEKPQPCPKTGLDFEFILQQGLRKPKPRKKCKEIPGRECLGTPG